MPAFPIIDSHVHLYDPEIISYPWLGSVPAINGRFLTAAYDAARGATDVDAMVFVEVDAAPDQAQAEALFVATLAETDPRIGSLVAAARLDHDDASEQLDQLTAIKGVTGVRHLIQQYPESDWCLRPAFVAGVRLLSRYDLSFDLCIKHHQLSSATELVRRCPDVRFVLDHIAKPGIAAGLWEPWATDLRQMAALPNVVCKLSGILTEAQAESWTIDDVRPYIAHAIDCFGFSRLLFGSDWPVVNLAGGYHRWVAVLDEVIAGSTETEQRLLYRDNAIRSYRMKV